MIDALGLEAVACAARRREVHVDGVGAETARVAARAYLHAVEQSRRSREEGRRDAQPRIMCESHMSE